MVQPIQPGTKRYRLGVALTETMAQDNGTKPPQKAIFWATLWERNPIGECADSMLDVSACSAVNGCIRMRAKYGRTDDTRNKLARTFLTQSKNDDDTLVMLDNDHIHPWDVVVKLAAANKPVIGGLAFKRGKPFEPCAYLKGGDGFYHSIVHIPENVIGEVDCVGHAAIAVQRKALLQLQRCGHLNTWWKYEYEEDGGSPSEDMYFARICAEAGIAQWVHCGVVSPHHMDAYADKSTWDEYISKHPELVSTNELKVSVIIPTRGRPEQFKACIEGLYASTADSGIDVEVVVIADNDDMKTTVILEFCQDAPIAFPGLRVVHNSDPSLTAVEKWNIGAAHATGDWLVLGADDLEWGKGWLEAALQADKGGFVGFNDGHTDSGSLSTHFMMRRDYITKHNGGVLAIPHYHSWYIDVEATERAKRAGLYVNCAEAKVEHLHPVWKTADVDDTYRRGARWHDEDKRTFEARQAAGFIDDFPAILTKDS